MYLIFLSIFFLLYGWLAKRDIFFALQLFLFLLPAYLIRFSLGPLPSTALEGMFAILITACLWKWKREGMLKEASYRFSRSLFFWPGLLLVFAAGISVFWSADPRAALGIWKAYFIEPFLFYGLLLSLVRTKEDWKKLFIPLGLTVYYLTMIALIQRITGWWSPEWEWTLPGQRRVTGPYTSPNALGLSVGPVVALFTVWWFRGRTALSSRMKLFIGSVIAAGLTSILLAVSRGALVATLAAVSLVAFFTWSKKKTALIGLAGLLLLFAIPSSRQQITELATFQVASGQSRLALYEGTIATLKERPVRGNGLASFAERFEEVRPRGFSEDLIYPHQFFLNFWSETGLLGLIAILWMMVVIIRETLKQKSFGFHWYFLAPLLVVFLHGLIDVSYFKNDLAMLTWFFLAGFGACLVSASSPSAKHPLPVQGGEEVTKPLPGQGEVAGHEFTYKPNQYFCR